jgi:hypothetical protein
MKVVGEMSAPQVDPARRKEQIKEVARATGANGLRFSERVLAIFSVSGLLDDSEHSERPRLTDLRRDCSSAAIGLRDQRASGIAWLLAVTVPRGTSPVGRPPLGKTFPSRLGVVPTGVPTGGGLPSILTALRVAGAKQNRGSFAHGGEDPPRCRQLLGAEAAL